MCKYILQRPVRTLRLDEILNPRCHRSVRVLEVRNQIMHVMAKSDKNMMIYDFWCTSMTYQLIQIHAKKTWKQHSCKKKKQNNLGSKFGQPKNWAVSG